MQDFTLNCYIDCFIGIASSEIKVTLNVYLIELYKYINLNIMFTSKPQFVFTNRKPNASIGEMLSSLHHLSLLESVA